MKKIFILIFVTLSFSILKAQGNLQFNTTKFIEITAVIPNANVPPYFYKDSTFTVPQGKVWKIESVIGTHNCSTGAINLYLDGKLICGNTGYGTFPIWLSHGTYSLVIYSMWNGSYKAAINLIEFNIIP